MKKLTNLKANQISTEDMQSVKGGAEFNLFCQWYTYRVTKRGETPDDAVLATLSGVDAKIDDYIAAIS